MRPRMYRSAKTSAATTPKHEDPRNQVPPPLSWKYTKLLSDRRRLGGLSKFACTKHRPGQKYAGQVARRGFDANRRPPNPNPSPAKCRYADNVPENQAPP